MRRLHHINLAVPALEPVVSRVARLVDAEPRPRETLASRGVELQRFELDGVWLILVAPTHASSPVQHWLDRRGPGLFLLSFEADSLTRALDALAEEGLRPAGPVRDGLDDWRVVDLESEPFAGLPFQLTEVLGGGDRS